MKIDENLKLCTLWLHFSILNKAYMENKNIFMQITRRVFANI